MATARNIITLALESMNKLAPGETLDADLAAVCLRHLNAIADDWSAGRDMTPRDVIASGAVTGASLTLGASPFAAIPVGEEIISAQADGFRMRLITMQQYNDIPLKTESGRPEVYAWDGMATVYLYPAATGNTINLLTRAPFSSFADLDTNYTLPAGYQGAFAASLAVALAPALLGGVPPGLQLAEKKALFNVANANIRPAIISTDPLTPSRCGNILSGDY
jgi:hypothetical protein